MLLVARMCWMPESLPTMRATTLQCDGVDGMPIRSWARSIVSSNPGLRKTTGATRPRMQPHKRNHTQCTLAPKDG